MEDHLHSLLDLAEVQNALLRTFELDCVCHEFEYDGTGKNEWVPFPQPTRVHILVDERDTTPHRRFRAEYDPQVVRWYSDAAAMMRGRRAESFVNRYHTEIGDGRQTTSYGMERRWRPSVYRQPSDIHLTGEGFLLSRFGRRQAANQIGPGESEPVRLARAILEQVQCGAYRIVERRAATWENPEDGPRLLRLEQAFARGARHVYWLDPERGYALLRFAQADAGEELETLFEVEDLSPVAPDFWYPARVASSALSPAPRQTSPVPVNATSLPADILPSAREGVTHWETTRTLRLPKADSLRCRYELSNVRVGLEVPADAFEFHPPVL